MIKKIILIANRKNDQKNHLVTNQSIIFALNINIKPNLASPPFQHHLLINPKGRKSIGRVNNLLGSPMPSLASRSAIASTSDDKDNDGNDNNNNDDIVVVVDLHRVDKVFGRVDDDDSRRFNSDDEDDDIREL